MKTAVKPAPLLKPKLDVFGHKPPAIDGRQDILDPLPVTAMLARTLACVHARMRVHAHAHMHTIQGVMDDGAASSPRPAGMWPRCSMIVKAHTHKHACA